MSHNLGVIGVQVSWRTDTVYSLFPILFDTCVQLTASAGPFTPAKISGLSIGRVQDNVLTLGCPGMDASHALPSSSAGLSADHIPLYFSCSLEHRAVVWKYSREMMHLEWWGGQTSGLNLVQVADENAAVQAAWAEPSADLTRAVVWMALVPSALASVRNKRSFCIKSDHHCYHCLSFLLSN